MKLLVVTLRPLNTRKFAKNATFHSSKFLKLKLSSHAIILCNFFLLNYTIFNCIKVICPRFSHILQFSVFLVLSVYPLCIHSFFAVSAFYLLLAGSISVSLYICAVYGQFVLVLYQSRISQSPHSRKPPLFDKLFRKSDMKNRLEYV